jgi:hypothetical protein
MELPAFFTSFLALALSVFPLSITSLWGGFRPVSGLLAKPFEVRFFSYSAG